MFLGISPVLSVSEQIEMAFIKQKHCIKRAKILILEEIGIPHSQKGTRVRVSASKNNLEVLDKTKK